MRIDSTVRSRPAGRDASSLSAMSFQLSRNVLIQALVIAMVAATGLTVLAWPLVAAWTLIALVAAAAEDQILRVATKGEDLAEIAGVIAPWLRALATTVYAIAVLALLVYGGPGVRLFAFTLMACSMAYVLMRYYRSPLIFLAGISPYLAILGLVGFVLARREVMDGHVLGAISCTFTIALFAIFFWSARAQLAASWMDLQQAREEAEQREHAAAAANRAKSHFLATMSHELRTPLNGVLGMVQALTVDKLTDVQRERVKIIRRSSETLLSVLNDLLDLSKIEASELELELVEFDLEHLVRGVSAAFQPGANKKGVTFEFEVTDQAQGRYIGDSARVRRILYNLATNAVNFTESGGITVLADLEAEYVVFQVIDTGIGIAPEHLSHLFEDFFQVDTSLARQHGGSGLGLAICRELTKLMCGTIDASSELGQGSTFTVRIPLTPAHAAPQAIAADEKAAEAQPAELRVLAAEDNDTNQLVLKTLLAQAGINPAVVVNGREALAAWERQAWDIILMDIRMPEMDGIAATKAIRLREAETGRARTPILAVTANAMTHQVVEYEAAGMDGLVTKPIDIANLFGQIEQALDKATASQPVASQASAA